MLPQQWQKTCYVTYSHGGKTRTSARSHQLGSLEVGAEPLVVTPKYAETVQGLLARFQQTPAEGALSAEARLMQPQLLVMLQSNILKRNVLHRGTGNTTCNQLCRQLVANCPHALVLKSPGQSHPATPEKQCQQH